MRHFLILFTTITLLFSCSSILDAQNSLNNKYAKLIPPKKIGESILTCLYYHKVTDPVLSQNEHYWQMLVLGNNNSVYSDYRTYIVDSVANIRGYNKFPRSEFVELYQKYAIYSERKATLKNFKEGILSERMFIFMDNYLYTENIPDFNWKLEADTMTVCGYLCRKAITEFRGRIWQVWYAEDIKYSDGPWKFHGLPGLILKADSEDGEISFKAYNIQFRKIDIKFQQSNDFKTTRERLMKTEYSYRTNSKSFTEGIVEVVNGKLPNRRLFYNPIEKDYVFE